MSESVYDAGPSDGAFAITPDDNNDLPQQTLKIYVGGAGTNGDLKVDMVDGSTVSFTGLLIGRVYDFKVKKVYATGTDITDIIGLV